MPRNFLALVSTPGKVDVVPTKKEARERMRAWKEEREARVRVAAVGDEGYIAREVGEAIVLHEYDPVTKRRIEKPLPPALTPEEVRARYLEPEPERAPKRRGRRPVTA